MTALEFKGKYMKAKFAKSATVLALINLPDRKYVWWHVHNEEELPEGNRAVISTKHCSS